MHEDEIREFVAETENAMLIGGYTFVHQVVHPCKMEFFFGLTDDFTLLDAHTYAFAPLPSEKRTVIISHSGVDPNILCVKLYFGPKILKNIVIRVGMREETG